MLSSRGEFAFGLLASPLGRSDVEKIDGFDGGSRSDVGFECEFLFGLLCLFERRGAGIEEQCGSGEVDCGENVRWIGGRRIGKHSIYLQIHSLTIIIYFECGHRS